MSLRVAPGATFSSEEKPTLTPPEPPSRSSLPTENPTGAVSELVTFTVTHSPATTCRTNGVICLVRALIAAPSPFGTKAVRPPLRVVERSMAVRSNLRRLAVDGQGSPGDDVPGGSAPVLAGST